MTLAGIGPANAIDPARFADLPAGYMTTANASSRAASLYGPPGTFDPDIVLYDEANKDVATLGEFLTQAVPAVAAPEFVGDVLTVNGETDLVFCPQPHCENIKEEAKFYPAARSVEYGESIVSLLEPLS